MKNSGMKRGLLMGLAGAAFAFATPAMAQETTAAAAGAADSVNTAEEVVVPGQITYRNRTEEVAPVLEYGLDYFQRFEPLTVGDALKRVPSVSFLSDVTESDGVRLRGLDPAYTQILINGEQVPGSGSSSGAFGNGADGAFFVDRIPAELIERVEVVRSASANRSGDALAGAINIVLRDGYSLEGGYIRAGLLYFANDGQWGETFGGVWGGKVAGGRLLLGANMQDRHNPKDKYSAVADEPGDPFEEVEVQTDVRDGTDYSANFSYEVPAFGGELKFDGFFVHTDRYENEDSFGYEAGAPAPAALAYINDNNVDISQDSWSLNGGYQFSLLGGETRIKLGYASFKNEEFEFEDEAAFDLGLANYDGFESAIAFVNLDDKEMKAKLEHERELGAVTLEFGLHYQKKERDNLIREADDDTGAPLATVPRGGALVDRADLEVVAGGNNTIERTRLDPYVMLSSKNGPIAWEAGLRYETTDVDIEDRDDGGVVTRASNDYQELLPSVSVKWSVTEDDRFIASVARTVRNPSFDFLSPATLEAELGENDFIGNPALNPETAWGLDVGYERRLGKVGVFGVNFFYRDVKDVIEVFSTGVVGSEGPGTFELSARNTGDGKVYGVEFDLSTPLSVVGLPNTGLFLNYSWLDSDIDDEFGSRRFNSQAEYVLNVGFIHDMPSWAASFGASYRKQGDAESRVVGEEVVTEYGADLEVFLEKRFGERFNLRLTGSNLLDESKGERFNKFETIADQRDRDFDEYEVETETSGPIFQIIGRYAF